MREMRAKPAWVDLLRTHGDDIPWELRREIVSLGAAAVGPLIDIVGDTDLRRFKRDAAHLALELLAEIGSPEGLERILLLGRNGEDIYSETTDALERWGATFLEVGLALQCHPEIDVRSYAARVLGRIDVKDERIFSALCKLTTESGFWGAHTLKDYGDPRAIPFLHELIEATLDKESLSQEDSESLDEWIFDLRDMGGTPSARAVRWKTDKRPPGGDVWPKAPAEVISALVELGLIEARPVIDAVLRHARRPEELVLFVRHYGTMPAELVLFSSRREAAESLGRITYDHAPRLGEELVARLSELPAGVPVGAVVAHAGKYEGPVAGLKPLSWLPPANDDTEGIVLDVFLFDEARRFDILLRLLDAKSHGLVRVRKNGRNDHFAFETKKAPFARMTLELWTSELHVRSLSASRSGLVVRLLERLCGDLLGSPRRTLEPHEALARLTNTPLAPEIERALADAVTEFRVAAPWTVLPHARTLRVEISDPDPRNACVVLHDAGRRGLELETFFHRTTLGVEGDAVRVHRTSRDVGELLPSAHDVCALIAIVRGIAQLVRDGAWSHGRQRDLEVRTPLGPVAIRIGEIRAENGLRRCRSW